VIGQLMEIKIAAKVDATDQQHFEDVIAPLLREPFAEAVRTAPSPRAWLGLSDHLSAAGC
jgi:hypothetical protein